MPFQRGTSNEYHNIHFHGDKKNIYLLSRTTVYTHVVHIGSQPPPPPQILFLSDAGHMYFLMLCMPAKISADGISFFVLRFYGPVNPMGSCRAWSVYLTTLLLGWASLVL